MIITTRSILVYALHESKEQLILKAKSSESVTHDVVEGFELYEASIGIPRNSIGWIN